MSDVDPAPRYDDTDDWSFNPDVPSGQAGGESLAPGQRFAGVYVIQGELGAGGMGTVYRARDERLERDVALKLLAGQVTPVRLARFRREGQLTAQLRHPGIVTVHAAGEADGVPYLAYELVEGGRTLRDALREQPRDARVRLLRRVAEAVGVAHDHGVVHRDLKPENVLLGADGRPRVADFGLARGRDDERLTATGAPVGTPFYMAPEQFLARAGEPGPPCDVWALGVMLYEALTGRRPFDARGLAPLAAQIAGVEPDPPRVVEPEVSRGLERVCLVALRKDPLERYADAGQLAEDLRRALAGEPVRAAVRGRRRRLAVGVGLASCALLVATLSTRQCGGGAAPSRPPTPPRAAGAALEADGRYLDAAAHYARDPGLAQEEGAALLAAGQPERAAAAVARRLTADPQDLAARRLELRVALALGERARAEALLDAYRRLDTGPNATVLAAEVLRQAGGDPRPLLREALASRPASPELRAALARESLQRGRPWVAWRVLGDGAGDAPLRAALKGLAEDPPRWAPAGRLPQSLRVAAARSLLAIARREVAFLEAQDDPRRRRPPAGALDPNRRRVRAERSLEGVLALSEEPATVGRAHVLQGKLREPGDARRSARLLAALRLIPDDVEARSLLAECWLRLAQPARALELLTGMAGPEVEWVRARAQLATGRVVEAAPGLRASLTERPDDLRRVQAVAECLAQAGLDAEASAARARAALLQGARRDEAAAEMLRTGDEEDRLDDEARASGAGYARVLELDPLHPLAFFRRGTHLYLQGERPRGLRHALVAIARHPVFVSDLYGVFQVMHEARRELGGGSLRALLDDFGDEDPLDVQARAFVCAVLVDVEGRAEWIVPGLQAFDAVLEDDPGLPWAYALRAAIELRAGAWLDAERDLLLAEEAAPDCGTVHMLQAWLAASQGAPPGEVLAELRAAEEVGFQFTKGQLQVLQAYPAFTPYLGRLDFQPFLRASH